MPSKPLQIVSQYLMLTLIIIKHAQKSKHITYILTVSIPEVTVMNNCSSVVESIPKTDVERSNPMPNPKADIYYRCHKTRQKFSKIGKTVLNFPHGERYFGGKLLINVPVLKTLNPNKFL